MDSFTEEVYQYIRTHSLIDEGDHIVIGLSGGADSTALTVVLKRLKDLLKIDLLAVYVNHGLRGDDAVGDAVASEKLADSLSVDFNIVNIDPAGYARDNGRSVEEASRILRYEALDAEGVRAYGAGGYKIAVAHHSLDQAETILFNMLRGTGLSGLLGMRPMRGNIIRPLLSIEKSEIYRFLAEEGIPFVTDYSNLSTDYTRGAIRNVIIPYMEQLINSRSAEHITALAEKLTEADDFIRAEAQGFLRDHAVIEETPAGGRVLRIDKYELKEKMRVLRIYVIIEGLKMMGVPLKDWSDRHFNDLDKLLFMGKGKHLDLVGGVRADNIERDLTISWIA